MKHDHEPEIDWSSNNSGPSTLTLLPTYKCTAACTQCCFGSSPSVTERLPQERLLQVITEASECFPNTLKLVVFSGGECFTLGSDLFEAIEHATKNHKLLTRTVSNGYWGKSPSAAQRTMRLAKSAGLTELNLSTGRDHAEYIPIDWVINAAHAAIQEKITCLVTIEADAEDSNILNTFRNNSKIRELINENSKMFRLQTNSWMRFADGHKSRKKAKQRTLGIDGPCQQLFTNLVVTPTGKISSCCGLTFEYIPEMAIGNITQKDLRKVFTNQIQDFLKIWLRTDGPVSIAKKIDSKNCDILEEAEHMCQVCATLLRSEENKKSIREQYLKHVPDVLTRFHFQNVLHNKGVNI